MSGKSFQFVAKAVLMNRQNKSTVFIFLFSLQTWQEQVSIYAFFNQFSILRYLQHVRSKWGFRTPSMLRPCQTLPFRRDWVCSLAQMHQFRSDTQQISLVFPPYHPTPLHLLKLVVCNNRRFSVARAITRLLCYYPILNIAQYTANMSFYLLNVFRIW